MSRTLEGLCAAVLDLDDGAARGLAGDVEGFTRQLPPPARAALSGGLAVVDGVALARAGRRLHRLDRPGKAKLVAQLSASPATAELLEALKVPVLLVHGATAAGATIAARNEAPPVRPDADLATVPAGDWPGRSTADVVVIGSGAGGAMAARVLAGAGLRTVVLEEGRRFGVDEFRTGAPLDRFAALYRDAGATVALGRPPVMLPIGRGVGGTTLVNSGTCYRTPDEVMQRWRDDHGVALADPAALGPVLDEVADLLRVGPVPDAVMGTNGRLALAGAAALGWSAHPITRNAPGCGGCCQCAIGCPRNAKFGTHLNALPAACADGAQIVTHARVSRVLHAGDRVIGVRARRPDGSELQIVAPRVVVAAGASETPLLLRRSGLGRHRHLGRNLAVHPAVSAAGWFEEQVDSTSGVLQSVGIDELHRSDGILIEATATPPGMGSMVLPGAGRPLAEQIADAGRLATLGAMVADAPAGRVHGRHRATIRYDLTRRDGARLVQSIAAMGRVLFAAGATSVLTGIRGHERVATVEELDDAVAHAHPHQLHVAAFHPTGTARMGADPERHPVDEEGRLRGITGLWLADASVLPTCPEVNPQMTIMALATAVARGVVAAAP